MKTKIFLTYILVTIVLITGVYIMPKLKSGQDAFEFYHTQVAPKDLPKDAVILDVRNGSEHTEIALKRPHYFVELPNLNAGEFVKEHHLNGQKLYILCKSGKRATKAAQMFEAAGYKNVAIITGGIDNVKAQKLEIVEQNVISMERQVRIAAGLFVVLGVLLGLFVSPWFLLLPLFVGSGLIYAGISNSCGLAEVLSLMPWNK